MKPYLPWFLAGLLLSSVAVAALSFLGLSPLLEKERKEWELRPVLVVSRDVPEGRALTVDDLTQWQLPARFLSDSVVRAEELSRVVGSAPSMPLKQGELLLWAAFADYSVTDECFGAIVARVNAIKDAARDGALSRFEGRMGSPLPKPEPSPAPEAEASGEVSIVVLAAQVPQGQVLEESMLVASKRPKALVTASFIPAQRLRDVVGARVLVPLEAKDALMWQMLDDAQRPRRAVSCMLEVGATLNEAHERARREEAAAFIRGKEAR